MGLIRLIPGGLALAILSIGSGFAGQCRAERPDAATFGVTLMWQVPSTVQDKELEYLARCGIKVVHHFQITNWRQEDIQAYLDRLNRHQLKALLYLGHVLDHATSGASSWHAGEKAEKFVMKWKNHPAIFGWHTFDEPKEASKSAAKPDQIRVFREIKRIDQSHPIVVSTNLLSDSDYENYFAEDAFDILEVHAYPDASALTRPQLLLSLLEKHKKGGYPVWMTMRAFNGDHWTELGRDSLSQQYTLACESKLVTALGVYGWLLKPNTGINSVPEIKKQFEALPRNCKEAGNAK